MKVSLIKVGNSRGIRIPKPIIEECHLSEEVTLEIKNKTLIISPIQNPRDGWDLAFEKMSMEGDDILLENTSSTKWDNEEWEWN